MSQNQNLDATWQYHSGTKHSYVGLRTNPHSLDWKNKPLLFKIYPTLEVTRLPRDFRETSVPALAAIAAAGLAASGPLAAATVQEQLTRWDATVDLTMVGLPPGLPWPQLEATIRAAAPQQSLVGLTARH